MARSYSILCWVAGTLFVLTGLVFYVSFFRSLAPNSPPALGFPIGPNGFYFVAFSGSCLVGWGGCLFAAARGQGGRAIGTATAVALVLSALYRIAVWFMGDFAWGGETPRIEAIVFLSLALAFLWLRPGRAMERV